LRTAKRVSALGDGHRVVASVQDDNGRTILDELRVIRDTAPDLEKCRAL